MQDASVIQELDILVAVAVWLNRQGFTIWSLSISRGRGRNAGLDKSQLVEALERENIATRKVFFKGRGPDIEAESDRELWLIECKGAGTGKLATQRNNFDRALASVVSYYDAGVTALALALPETPAYLSELKRRVRKPLRQRLKLWVLLYSPISKTIRAVSPDDDF